MAKTAQINETQAKNEVADDKTPVCGIIMPIAKTDGYPEKHWADVYSILCEVATQAEFNPNLVSFDDDVGIIHKRIVQNIYSNPIVICDISSRNANVMLELGMRLAFDKPTIIIKDDKTPYSFDIAAIEHIDYPSDLRYQLINEFKQKLHSKIIETYKRSKEDKNYTTFLKHFGTFKVAKLEEKEVSGVEYISAELKELKALISSSPIFRNAEVSSFSEKTKLPSYLNAKSMRVLTIDLEKEVLDELDYPHLSDYLVSKGVKLMTIGPSKSSCGIQLKYSGVPGLDQAKSIYNLVHAYLKNPH